MAITATFAGPVQTGDNPAHRFRMYQSMVDSPAVPLGVNSTNNAIGADAIPWNPGANTPVVNTDTPSIWSNNQPTRFTAPVTGVYLFTFTVFWASGTFNSGNTITALVNKTDKNNKQTTLVQLNSTWIAANTNQTMGASRLISLDASKGEYVEVYPGHNNGQQQTVNSNSFASMMYVGE